MLNSAQLRIAMRAAAVATAFGAAQATAGVMIDPVSATTNMGESFPLVHAIDQSGLTANYVSGVTNFDTFVAATTHDSQPGNDFVAVNGTGSIVFNLGSVLGIDEASVWNFGGRAGFISFGIKDITLEWSADNITYKPIGAFTLPQGVTGVNTPAVVLAFGAAVNAQYIRTNVLSNYGSGSALGEIAFSQVQVPEPTSLALLAIGLAALGIRRRRAS